MESVIITGGLGQVGSSIIDELPKSTHILVLDNYSNNKTTGKNFPNHTNLNIVDFDITDINQYDELNELNQSNQYSKLIHTAAQISVPHSEINPIFDAKVNIMGTLNILEWSKSNSINQLVTIGSAATIGIPKSIPISTEQHKNPISAYGISKSISEDYTLYYANRYNLDYKVLRPYNIYSRYIQDNDPYSGVISNFINQAKQNIPFEIHGDGSQLRDFIHASDVAKLTLNSFYFNKSQVFNIATGKGTSIIGLSKMIANLFDIEWNAIFKEKRKNDIQKSIGTKSILYNFEPKSLSDGLKLLISHLN